jgi:hypothetical protein
MTRVDLFGRRELLDRLAASTAPVAVLVGDSGIGKTAVLEESQAETTAIAPGPVQVAHAPGSLQIALLDSLAAAVSLMVDDMTAAERVGRLLVDAAGRVADMRFKDLRAAVGRHLLSLVRSRVGEEMADLLADLGAAVTVSAEESLAARITAASDGDVVDQIVSFADEVVKLAGERGVCVALDDLDRLDDGDLRRLADLPNRLPPGFQIRGSFTTWHATSRARFETLQLGGVEGVPIGGLGERDVAAWLDAEGLDDRLTPSVMAATNGYPVHVADAVALLHPDPSPETLASLTPDQIIEVRARQAWRELDAPSQVVAAKLCVYTDPIPTPRVCRLLGVDEMAWGTLAMRLVDSGLLLDDQRRWFHELRRRVIWRDLISDEMRRAAIDAATDELRGQIALPSARPTDFVDFARVVADNGGLQDAEAGLAAAVEATRDELAIAAAALELIEYTHGEQAIDAEVLLSHARNTYAIDGDPPDALDRLVGRGLMYVASSDRAAVAAPIWGSQATIQALLGRAAAELGRIPVAQLASAAFESVIRPRLGPFDAAKYGVGAPSMASASEEVASLHRRPRSGVVYLGSREPGIAIRGSHGAVPLYAMVSYREVGERDAALAGLDRLREDLWGEDVILHEVFPIPSSTVPSLRFARALKWLDGRRDFSLHMLQPVDVPEPYDLADRVAACQQLRYVVRERSSVLERYAYDVEDQVGYAYAQSSDGEVIVEIQNFEGLVEVDPSWSRELHAPFGRLRLSDHLGLTRDQSIGGITWRSGRVGRDPLTETIVDLSKAAARFNHSQVNQEFEFDEPKLSELLREAFARRESDGRALLAALPGMGLSQSTPTTTYAVLKLDEPSPGWVPGAHALLATALLPRRGDEDVVFRIVGPNDGGSAAELRNADLLQHVFGIDSESALSSSLGVAIDGLARMLGYGAGEVRFRYSGEPIP